MIISRIQSTIFGYIITLISFCLDFFSLYFISQVLSNVYSNNINSTIIYLFIGCIAIRTLLIPNLKFMALLIFYDYKKKNNLELIQNILNKDLIYYPKKRLHKKKKLSLILLIWLL